MTRNRSRKNPPPPPNPPRRGSNHGWGRIARLVLIFGIVAYLLYRQQSEQPPDVPPPPRDRADINVPAEKVPPTHEPPREEGDAAQIQTLLANQTIRDREGNVVYRGDVDLSETIARIRRNETLRRFANDGSTFQNRERRLPNKARGYYREWVHPTPDAQGPGPQRVVSGEQNDFWYTPDHYQTFQSLHGGAVDE